ncbi:YciI family protein [Halomonas organivorans]
MNNEPLSKDFIVGVCEEKGFLAKQLYVVSTTSAGDMDRIMANLEEHLAYQVELERRGIMFAAGPVFSEDGKTWHGEGMVIIRAGSLEEARDIAGADPMHRSGARRFTVRPWLMNEGTIQIRVNYSDASIEMV